MERPCAQRVYLSLSKVGSRNEGFTGAGYVDYAAATEDFLEWTVYDAASVPTRASVSWRYALGQSVKASRDLSLSVNGVPTWSNCSLGTAQARLFASSG